MEAKGWKVIFGWTRGNRIVMTILISEYDNWFQNKDNYQRQRETLHSNESLHWGGTAALSVYLSQCVSAAVPQCKAEWTRSNVSSFGAWFCYLGNPNQKCMSGEGHCTVVYCGERVERERGALSPPLQLTPSQDHSLHPFTKTSSPDKSSATQWQVYF